jgi:hypothetical protein
MFVSSLMSQDELDIGTLTTFGPFGPFGSQNLTSPQPQRHGRMVTAIHAIAAAIRAPELENPNAMNAMKLVGTK